jgi:hypothetical protein
MPLAAARIGGWDMRRPRPRFVVTKPGIGHVFIGEDLQMVSVSDLTADQDIEGVELRLVIVPARVQPVEIGPAVDTFYNA